MCLSDVLPLSVKGDAESQWLQDTGLAGLVGGLGLDGDHQGLLSTLTQTQVAAVCRRLDIYARSARRRQKAPVRDVRDIFGVFTSRIRATRSCLPEVSVMSLLLSYASVHNSVSCPRAGWGCLGAALPSACVLVATVSLDASASLGSVAVITNTNLTLLVVTCYLYVLLAPKPDNQAVGIFFLGAIGRAQPCG